MNTQNSLNKSLDSMNHIKGMIDLDQIKTKFNPHFLHCVKEYNGTLPKKIILRKIPASNLLFHPSRFDLLIKYLYIKFWIKGVKLS